MKQISATLKQFYFRHPNGNFLFLLGILILSILNLSLYQFNVDNTDRPIRAIRSILSIQLISGTFGIVLHNCIRSLSNTYLWTINLQYRKTVYLSVLVIVCIVFITQLPLIIKFENYSIFVGILSLTTMLTFSLFFTRSNHILYLIFPYMILNKGNDLEFSFKQIIFGLLVMNFMIFLLKYIDYKNPELNSKVKIKEGWSNKILNIGLNKNKIINKKRSLDLAIAMPGVYLGINTVFYFLFFSVNLVVFSILGKNITSVFAILMLMFMLNFMYLLQILRSLPQVLSIAHVFSGAKQSGIKSRIVNSTDKIILINNLIFISLTLIVLNLLNIETNYPYLVASMFIFLIVVFNSYLFVFSTEMELSFELLITVLLSYWLVMTIVTSFLKNYIEPITFYPFISVIIVLAMLSRKLSQKAFENVSFERLVKIK